MATRQYALMTIEGGFLFNSEKVETMRVNRYCVQSYNSNPIYQNSATRKKIFSVFFMSL